MILKIMLNRLYFTKTENCYKLINIVLQNNVRHAGHSHWQNVKNIKEAKDKLKNDNIRIVSLLVQSAIKDGNGIRDPKLNSQLAAAINRAKEMSVSMSTIERILMKSESIDPYFTVFQAPGGIFFIVESCNKNVIRERNLMQAIVKKYGFKITSDNIIAKMFKHIAEVVCKSDKSLLTDEEKALEIALEVGADDVMKDIDQESGNIVFKFLCDPINLRKVEAALLSKSISVIFSVDYLDPITRVEINDETKLLIDEMANRLCDEFEYVQRVFVNTTK